MKRRTFGVVAGLFVLVALVTVPIPRELALASCAAPRIAFEDGRSLPRITPGETLTLTGEGFVRGCDDGGDDDFGCAPPLYEQAESDLDLTLVRGRQEWPLGQEDAHNEDDRLGVISWTVTIPDDVGPGPARLVPTAGEPLDVRVAAVPD